MNPEQLSELLGGEATRSMYESRVIPKFRRSKGRKIKVGERQLLVPNDNLKKRQTTILEWLQSKRLLIHPAAHGFVPNRGIRTAAEKHVGAQFVLRMDLENFFPTTPFNKVADTIAASKNHEPSMVAVVRNWCFYGGYLPQGAPTSPYLSNLAAYRLDHRIATLCEKWRINRLDEKLRMEPITYTRYADDLIFSSDYPFLYDIVKIVKIIVQQSGWTLNTKKTILRRHCARQVVTGVTVNEKVSVPRPTRRALRGRIHRLIIDRVQDAVPAGHELRDGEPVPLNPNPNGDPFTPLLSLVSYYKHINEDQGSKLVNQLAVAVEVHTKPEAEWSLATRGYLDGRTNRNSG